jgi:hypothetical protein
VCLFTSFWNRTMILNTPAQNSKNSNYFQLVKGAKTAPSSIFPAVLLIWSSTSCSTRSEVSNQAAGECRAISPPRFRAAICRMWVVWIGLFGCFCGHQGASRIWRYFSQWCSAFKCTLQADLRVDNFLSFYHLLKYYKSTLYFCQGKMRGLQCDVWYNIVCVYCLYLLIMQ